MNRRRESLRQLRYDIFSRQKATGISAFAVVTVSIGLIGCSADVRQPKSNQSTGGYCQSFAGRNIEGAVVTSARVEPATVSAVEACILLGEMPQDLKFEVRMPSEWNGRILFMGGGGFDGAITQFAHSSGVAGKGYATIATNHGHSGKSTLEGSPSWALDSQKLAEYGYLAVPRVIPPAKELLKLRYGDQRIQTAKMVYEGCSGGGRQGLIQAQRYPDLFDGVIARAPANSYIAQFLWYQKVAKQLARPGGNLSTSKVEALASTVMEKCDAQDGLADGVIGNPKACKVDLSSMKCTGAETDACFTEPQLQSLKAIYEPTDIAGYQWPGFPFGGEAASATGLQAWGGVGPTVLGEGFIKYMVAQDPSVDWLKLDPEQFKPRLAVLSSQIDAINPDMSRFSDRGGKLILWTGLTDWLITPNNAIDFYSKVVTAQGGPEKANDFVEFYTAPGVDHCLNGRAGGKGQGADSVDLVDPMFDWIEKGVKPSSKLIVATQTNPLPGQIAKKRPLCKYPDYPKYLGNGDPSLAESFACVKF